MEEIEVVLPEENIMWDMYDYLNLEDEEEHESNY